MTEPAYTISSPGAFGSGELKMLKTLRKHSYWVESSDLRKSYHCKLNVLKISHRTFLVIYLIRLVFLKNQSLAYFLRFSLKN